MADRIRFAVAHRRGQMHHFVMRVFGDDPVVSTGEGTYRLIDGKYRHVTKHHPVRIVSIHDEWRDAKCSC